MPRTLSFLRLLPALLVLIAGIASAADEPVDLVVVFKGERTLYLYRDGMPIHSYPVALGGEPEGHKRQEGDERTPEGAYLIDWRNPESLFYKSLHISYPDSGDMREALRHDRDPGGNIMIHGQPSYDDEPRSGDWTDGCIAVSNEAMDRIWSLVPDDTRIHIYP